MQQILKFENLGKFYSATHGVVVGLTGVNLCFDIGEFVAVTGESGSGKSTLANVVSGILPYENGEMLFMGSPTSHFDGADWETYRRDNVAYVSQNYGILAGNTVFDNVKSALILAGFSDDEAKVETENILKKVELFDMRNRRAAKLSSGQKQRLSIARALAKPAKILVADEPTGNLDSANSEMVVKLLKEASKTKLVLFITHDYAEAQDYVTRHVALRDGQVVLDEQVNGEFSKLEQADSNPQEDAKQESAKRAERAARKKNQAKLSAYVAGLQLRSKPLWSVVMALLCALTAFAVFAFLGTFIISLDDTSTRIYDDMAFRNGDKTRIVVTRADGSDMTEDDYSQMAGIKYVESVERYGYICDVSYNFEIDNDMILKVSLIGTYEETSGPKAVVWENVEKVEFVRDDRYLQTMPVRKDGKSILTAGRAPENMREVVVVGDASMIGEYLPLYIRDTKKWTGKSYIFLKVQVVGVTDYGDGLYVSDQLARMITHACVKDHLGYIYGISPLSDIGDYVVCDDTSFGMKKNMKWELPNIDNSVYLYLKTYDPEKIENAEGTGIHNSTAPRYLEISEENFDILTMKGRGNQVSVFVKDYSYVDRVLDKLHDMGYKAISPYKLSAVEFDDDLYTARTQTLIICAIAFLVTVFLQIILVRVLFGMQKTDFTLLSNIGLTCKTARRTIIWLLALFVVVGQILCIATIGICAGAGANVVLNITKYISPATGILLSFVHILAMIPALLWTTRAISKDVFEFSEQEVDIDLEEAQND